MDNDKQLAELQETAQGCGDCKDCNEWWQSTETLAEPLRSMARKAASDYWKSQFGVTQDYAGIWTMPEKQPA